MGEGQTPLIRIDRLRKSFGEFVAVDDLSLEIRRGEFFALLGPSGCGKTTLLRMLAGFETPTAGRILLDGADLTALPPYRRPVNMMFQSYALFPHLSVAGNIAFGLKRESLPRAEIDARVAEMLRLGRLEALAERKPHQLSGGQRQRVALVRALAKRPRVLLLDEPLAALDRKLREETQFELKDVQRRLGLTFVIVTHDQDEAMSLADRIGVMERGRLAQVGSPAMVYEQPASLYVAKFVGDINLLDVVLKASDGAFVEAVSAAAPAGLRLRAEAAPAAGAVRVLALRPERLVLLAAGEKADNELAGTVTGLSYLGDSSLLRIRLPDETSVRVLRANAGRHAGQPEVGTPVRIGFGADAGVLLERDP